MSSSDIEIQLNGEPRSAREGETVAELLDRLDVDRRKVVVELNRQIVRRNEVDDVELEDGDRVELVQFVGGG